MKQYVIGIDFGTLSARAALFDVRDGCQLAEHTVLYPHGVMDRYLLDRVKLEADFALQHPRDYLHVLHEAIPALLRQSGVAGEAVAGIGIDFTSCTVLPTDEKGSPLCFREEYRFEPHAYVKLWKHHAAQEQAARVNAQARQEPWIARYGGQISSEWVLPKVMEVLEKCPRVFDDAACFVEAGDWLVWQLTGRKCGSVCMAGYKALWSAAEGYPAEDFFCRLDPRLTELPREKLMSNIIPTGGRAGTLRQEVAAQLGLSADTVVASAIIDAHAALPALGLVEPGKMLMVMGTSTCHIMMAERERPVKGISGVVKDGIVEGYYAYEAGQPAVGDIFDWYIKNGVPADDEADRRETGVDIHTLLQQKAVAVSPKTSHLVALDWWNGNRSVLSDSRLSGLLVGLTLTTRPEEIYRALLESTAYGAKVIHEAFAEAGVEIRELYAAGGIPAKNPLMMQIYADVLDREIHVASTAQSPALGSALYAATAAGLFDSLKDAVRTMVHTEMTVYRPDGENAAAYRRLYGVYRRLHDYLGREQPDVMASLKGE